MDNSLCIFLCSYEGGGTEAIRVVGGVVRNDEDVFNLESAGMGLALIGQQAFEDGVLGECISFFEKSELRIHDILVLTLDPARAIALQGRGYLVLPGRVVLLELMDEVPSYLRAQFVTYSRGSGVVIAPEDEEFLNRIFLY